MRLSKGKQSSRSNQMKVGLAVDSIPPFLDVHEPHRHVRRQSLGPEEAGFRPALERELAGLVGRGWVETGKPAGLAADYLVVTVAVLYPVGAVIDLAHRR